jgi:hypothetical protein
MSRDDRVRALVLVALGVVGLWFAPNLAEAAARASGFTRFWSQSVGSLVYVLVVAAVIRLGLWWQRRPARSADGATDERA